MLTGRVLQRGDALSIKVRVESKSVATARSGVNSSIGNYPTFRPSRTPSQRRSPIVLLVKLTTEERKQITKRYTDNTEAYQLYLKRPLLLEQEDAGRIQPGHRAISKKRSPPIRILRRRTRRLPRSIPISPTTTSPSCHRRRHGKNHGRRWQRHSNSTTPSPRRTRRRPLRSIMGMGLAAAEREFRARNRS